MGRLVNGRNGAYPLSIGDIALVQWPFAGRARSAIDPGRAADYRPGHLGRCRDGIRVKGRDDDLGLDLRIRVPSMVLVDRFRDRMRHDLRLECRHGDLDPAEKTRA